MSPKTVYKDSLRGIKFNRDKTAFTFTHHDVEAPQFYFKANDFQVRVDESHIHILFGQKSHFEKRASYRSAIEISLPLKHAKLYLVDGIFTKTGLDKKFTFAQNLERDPNVKGALTEEAASQVALPASDDMYRSFDANYATSSVSNGQGEIEFMFASPSTMAYLANNLPSRESAGLKSVVAVTMSPRILYRLFVEIRNLLNDKNVESLEVEIESDMES